MVAKINIGSSLYGVLAYNQKKIDDNEGKVLLTNRMIQREDGNFNIRQCMQSFEMQLPQDIRTEKPIIHISLNPHPDDKLTDTQLADIAEEYMEKLGYGDQPYVVYKHEDINRHHIHIVSLRVDENGKKLNDKFEYRRSKEITRALEKKYGLHTAEKSNTLGESHLKKVDYEAGDIKRQISNTVKEIMGSYHFQSFNEYKALLSLYNIHAEEVKDEVRGRKYHGIVYSATNNHGKKLGNPIKSSVIGKSVGVATLERKIEQTAKIWKESGLKDEIKERVQSVLDNSTSTEHLKQGLTQFNIDLILRENKEGRIYGVTFIDHNNKIVLNGSRLGKAFSANAINALGENRTEREIKPAPIVNRGSQGEKESSDKTEYHDYSKGREPLIADILKMLFGKPSYNENDGYSSSDKKKRRKKRRYGRQQ